MVPLLFLGHADRVLCIAAEGQHVAVEKAHWAKECHQTQNRISVCESDKAIHAQHNHPSCTDMPISSSYLVASGSLIGKDGKRILQFKSVERPPTKFEVSHSLINVSLPQLLPKSQSVRAKEIAIGTLVRLVKTVVMLN